MRLPVLSSSPVTDPVFDIELEPVPQKGAAPVFIKMEWGGVGRVQ